MRTLLLLLLFCATAAHAQTKLSAGEAKVVREFMTGRMPVFKIEGASLHEAVAVIRAEWKRQHPDETFPVAVSGDAEMLEKGALQRLTFDLKNIPFYKALKILANGWLCEIDYGSSPGTLFTLQHSDADDMTVAKFPLTPGLLATLNVKKDATEEQVKDAFASAGIHFGKYMISKFYKNDLIVRAPQEIVDNVGCIYLMIDAGMKIDGTMF